MEKSIDMKVPEPETPWKIFFVPGFHFDPVWWNTQAHYVDTGYRLLKWQDSALRLIHEFLHACRKDPDYCFVLEQIPSLKPFWDSFPEERSFLRKLLKEERLELVGGTYNQVQSTLVGPEAALRSGIYGILFMREILGGKPSTSWQLDVFGHDPSFPQILSSLNLRYMAFSRGPFHQWGAPKGKINFPSEFSWTAPDGSRILTHYIASMYDRHYFSLRRAGKKRFAKEIESILSDLKEAALTPHLFVSLSPDFGKPLPDLGRLFRQWNKSHAHAVLLLSTPSKFFKAVEEYGTRHNTWFPMITRDMNPIYSGCAVSYADTKQAGRQGEVLLLSAETLAALASLFGASYPASALDYAWRQLFFTAHHDAITGSESDQVYIDLLDAWRCVYEKGRKVLEESARFLANKVDGTWVQSLAGSPEVSTGKRKNGRTEREERRREVPWIAVTVFNTLSWDRTDRIEVPFSPAGLRSLFPGLPKHGSCFPFENLRRGSVTLLNPSTGRPVPAEILCRNAEEAVLSFLPPKIPSLGYSTFYLGHKDRSNVLVRRSKKREQELPAIENRHFRVAVDPRKGGGIVSLYWKRLGREILAPHPGPANEVVIYQEYPMLPGFGEGPWNLAPSGKKWFSRNFPSEVEVEEGPVSRRLLITGPLEEGFRRQEIVLTRNLERIDFVTEIFNYRGSDRLFKVHFPLQIPNTIPVFAQGSTALGRAFGRDVDTAKSPWTLDFTAGYWAGLSLQGVLQIQSKKGRDPYWFPLSAGEIVVPQDSTQEERMAADTLASALIQRGIPATVTHAGMRRYGDIEYDSNLPNFRILLGSSSRNRWTEKVLSETGKKGISPSGIGTTEWGGGTLWVETEGDVPCLLLDGEGEKLALLAKKLASEMRKRGAFTAADTLFASSRRKREAPWGGAILINRGTPCYQVLEDGTLAMALFRSNTSEPSGWWIDPPSRKAPDHSAFQLLHWNHRFEYSLFLFTEDWRRSAAWKEGVSRNVPLLPKLSVPKPGSLPHQASLCKVKGKSVLATPLKKPGFFGPDLLRGKVPQDEKLVLRVTEMGGMDAKGKLTFAGEGSFLLPLAGKEAAAVSLASPFEEEGIEIPPQGGCFLLNLKANQTETLLISLRGTKEGKKKHPEEGKSPPLFSRYWLLNEGAAPEGFMPVTVLIQPPAMGCMPGESVLLSVKVSSSLRSQPVSGRVEILEPQGWKISHKDIPFELPPEGFTSFPLAAEAPRKAPKGDYLIYALAKIPGFPPVFDYGCLQVGSRKPPSWLEPGAPQRPVTAEFERETFFLAPGQEETIEVKIQNGFKSLLKGRVHLISPFELWEALHPRLYSFQIHPGETLRFSFFLRLSPAIKAGTYWMMAKVIAPGGPVYSRAAGVEIVSGRMVRVIGSTRSLVRGDFNPFSVLYLSPEPLQGPLDFRIRGPGAFQFKEEWRRFIKEKNGPCCLHIRGAVRFPFEEEAGTKRIRIHLAEKNRESLNEEVLLDLPRLAVAKRAPSPLSQRASLSAWKPFKGPEVCSEKAVKGGGCWTKEDLSVRSFLAWNRRSLFLAFAVKDSILFNDCSGEEIWKGDCLHFALNSTGPVGEPGCYDGVYEFGMALARGEPTLWCWHAPRFKAQGRVSRVPFSISRKGNQTLYRIALPWSRLLPMKAGKGRSYGFTFAVHDSDGKGRRETIQWTPGMVQDKDPSRFGVLFFQEG